jgi:pyruvate/2-oxoglutarate dehydrogenase complex dihydrolipoamide acyltransferase (E2) component
MPTPVKMPRLGESVAEGTIGAWIKHEGDYVDKDEAIAEIITDKISAELPSPVAGRLTKILVQADETVPVEADIALIEEQADISTMPPAQEPPKASAAPVKSVGQVATGVSQQAAVANVTRNGSVSMGRASSREEDEERQRVSPLARRLAREHGIDLNEIAGTGINGRVRKEDILAYVAQRQVTATQSVGASVRSQVTPLAAPQVSVETTVKSQATLSAAPESVPSVAADLDEEVILPSRMRLAIAEHMVRSKRTSPHATTVVEVDMTNIAKWLEQHKDEFKQREGYAISYVPFVMKAVCEGIRQVPVINATWTADNKIVVKKRIHLGIAVSSDAGLLVPTVYDADQYSLAGLAKQVSTLAYKARNNKLTVQDMQNSTFVVNNPGVFGTIISTPIINQPHAAILSMDAVVKRPVVIEDDAIAVRSMMYLCLSFDHRIMDGAEAARFLQAVRTKLQRYGREIDVY